MPRVDVTSRFIRVRVISPGRCAKKSFRAKRGFGLPKGGLVTFCCPKGLFSRGRCKVGVKAQSVAIPKHIGKVRARAIARRFA